MLILFRTYFIFFYDIVITQQFFRRSFHQTVKMFKMTDSFERGWTGPTWRRCLTWQFIDGFVILILLMFQLSCQRVGLLTLSRAACLTLIVWYFERVSFWYVTLNYIHPCCLWVLFTRTASTLQKAVHTINNSQVKITKFSLYCFTSALHITGMRIYAVTLRCIGRGYFSKFSL